MSQVAPSSPVRNAGSLKASQELQNLPSKHKQLGTTLVESIENLPVFSPRLEQALSAVVADQRRTAFNAPDFDPIAFMN